MAKYIDANKCPKLGYRTVVSIKKGGINMQWMTKMDVICFAAAVIGLLAICLLKNSKRKKE